MKVWIGAPAGLLAALAIAGCGTAAPAAGPNATPSQAAYATPPPTATATPAPTPTPVPGIGAAVTGKNGVAFLVDSATVVAAPFGQPNPAGYVTVSIEVSLTNHGASAVSVAGLTDFEILGPQGQTYNQVILTNGPDSPGGNLTPGDEMTGDIGYQVPPGAYRVAYTPLFGTALPPISIGTIS